MVTSGNERHTEADRLLIRELDEPAPTVTASGNAFDLIRISTGKGAEMAKPRKRNDEGGARRLAVPPTGPSPTVMAGGIGSVNTSQYHVGGGSPSSREPAKGEKPPYRVPSMAEVAKIPWNGFTAASTFSGCGGSCLGYRMAGFRVLWANEFVPNAGDSYVANAAAASRLDRRSIKDVGIMDVLRACGLRQGELDLLDGSPPCQAFSTAGKRHKGWGEEKKYDGGHSQRNEDLFAEYLRLLRGLQPRAFVAENVSGMAKGTCKGMFLEVLAAMKACGYRVACRMLDAQWLGVPQQRQRLIFVGVRNDLRGAAGELLMPRHPPPLPYRYSVRDAIPWISDCRHDTTGKGGEEGYNSWSAGDVTGRPSPAIVAGSGTDALNSRHWTVADCAVEPESDMTGKATGAAWDEMGGVGQSERYFQLVRPDPDGTCPTVTAAGGNAGLASVCHPTERRKFSIAELRRICAFPDDFVLTGSYAQQWACLGNAVPPLMMRAVAEAVRDGVLRRMA